MKDFSVTIRVLAVIIVINVDHRFKVFSLRVRIPRIYKGRDTKPYQYPFTAAVANQGYEWCGAAILDEKTVVTAAHCLLIKSKDDALHKTFSDFTFTVGSYINNKAEFTESIHQVDSVIVPDNFMPNASHPEDTDIVVVKVKPDIILSPVATKAKLPTDSSTMFSGPFHLLGWGMRDQRNPNLSTTSFPLQTTDVNFNQLRNGSALFKGEDPRNKFLNFGI